MALALSLSLPKSTLVSLFSVPTLIPTDGSERKDETPLVVMNSNRSSSSREEERKKESGKEKRWMMISAASGSLEKLGVDPVAPPSLLAGCLLFV